jgi:quercetin dioxygenase-like cupin family protein
MITRRFLMEGAAGVLFAQALGAQGRGGGAKVVFKHDVPDLTLKNWSATAVEVSYGPGESSPAHRHPGITIAYVLEGEIRSKVGDDPEKTYKVGEMFLETPGQLHAVSGNASATRPAKLLAILLAEKESQLTTPAQE